jgi:archaeal flagellar protein FlaJ
LLKGLNEKRSEIDPYYLFVLGFSLALFSSGYPIEDIIKRLGDYDNFPPYNKYFKRISRLVTGYGFKISSAISNSLKEIQVAPFKEFLIRFSQSISYGDSIVEFLERELRTASAIFQSTNERKQESMNTFLSLYGTLNSALVFLMVDVTIMSVLYSISSNFIVLLTAVLGVVSAMMTLVIYVVYKPFAKMIFPGRAYATALGALGATLAPILIFRTPVVIFGAAVVLICLGIYFKIMERAEEMIERDYLVFVRYFSRTYVAVGTLPHALLGVLRGELGSMKPLVKRMHNRSQLGIDKRKLFNIMSQESRSQMVMMGNAVMGTTLEAGGDVGFIGNTLSILMEMILNIRIRREQNAKAFETTVYTMQMTSAAVGGALIAVVGVFVQLFSQASTYSVFDIGQANVPSLTFDVLVLLVVLCYTSGFAICVAYGKPLALAIFNIGILLIITIVSFEIAHQLAEGIFAGVFQPGGVGSPTTSS